MSIGDLTEGEAREALERYEADVCRHAARQFAGVKHRALDVDDLKAEGRIAVLEALATYEGYGMSERSWVWRRVRNRIIDATRRLAPLNREETQIARRHAAGELPPELEQKGRLLAARRIRSLDALVGDGRPLLELLEDAGAPCADAAVLLGQRRRLLRQAIGELTPRQAAVMRLRVLEGLPMREVAERLGVSESRVSQLTHRASAIVAGKIHAVLENSSANLEMQTNVLAHQTEAQGAFTSPSTA